MFLECWVILMFKAIAHFEIPEHFYVVWVQLKEASWRINKFQLISNLRNSSEKIDELPSNILLFTLKIVPAKPRRNWSKSSFRSPATTTARGCTAATGSTSSAPAARKAKTPATAMAVGRSCAEWRMARKSLFRCVVAFSSCDCDGIKLRQLLDLWENVAVLNQRSISVGIRNFRSLINDMRRLNDKSK